MANEGDILNIWQNQRVEGSAMSIDDIRTRARQFRNEMRWRNFREYFGFTIVLTCSSCAAWDARSTVARAGFLAVIAGVFYLAGQLHRSVPADVPANLGLMDCITFHRHELERQLEVYRRTWQWILALVPGLALVTASAAKGTPLALLCAVWGTWVLAFVRVRKRDQDKASDIERQICELDAAQRH
jgi:hypothetical protein